MGTAAVTNMSSTLERELWTSFVSVLRSYLAAHTLNRSEQAILEVSATSLLVRVGPRTLKVEHTGNEGAWQRETGSPIPFRFDEHGRIITGGHTPENPQEMDIVAEQLAREITTP